MVLIFMKTLPVRDEWVGLFFFKKNNKKERRSSFNFLKLI